MRLHIAALIQQEINRDLDKPLIFYFVSRIATLSNHFKSLLVTSFKNDVLF